MKTFKLLLCVALVQGCLSLTTVWATPTVSQADAAARKALENKQYSAVVEAYREVDPKTLNDQSFYRLAIAQQKLDNPSAAQKALGMALEINPKGSFASSPERLAILKEEIIKGATLKTPSPDPIGNTPLKVLVADKAATTGVVEAKVVASTATPALAPVAQIQLGKTADSLTANKPMMAAPNKARDSGSKSEGLVEAIFVAFFWPVIVPGVSIILIGLWLAKKLPLRKFPLRKNSPVAGNSVESLVSLRESIRKNKLLIEMAGSKGSELYKVLEKIEPVVVKEIGRIAYRGSGDAHELAIPDQQLLQSLANLEASPMLLSGADPDKVMAYMFSSRASANFAFSVGAGVVCEPSDIITRCAS